MKLLILFFSVFIMMQDQPCAEIKLEVANVKNSQGVVRVLLFDGENGFPNDPKKAFKSASGEIINNKVTFTFKGIPKGAYAISVFHDSQNLGYLRTNILGIPKDDYGFSNNASGHFGPPSFEKAKFSVDKQKVEVRIRF